MFQSKCPQLILQKKHFPCGCNLPTSRQAKRSAPALLSSIIKILNLLLFLWFLPPSFNSHALSFIWAALCSLQTPAIFFHLQMATSHGAPCWRFLLLSGVCILGRQGQGTPPFNSPRETEMDHHIYHELIPRIPPFQSVTLWFLTPFSPRSKNTDILPVCWGPSCHTLAKPPPQGAFQGNSSKAGHSLSYLSCSFLHSFFFIFSIMCIYLLFLNSFYFIEVQLIYSVLLVSVHSNMIRLCTGVLSLSVSLCDPMDCSLAGSSAHGIFQARILDWVAISSSRGSSRPRVFSYIYISMYLFFFRFFSIIGYYKILNMVPCSNQ